MEKLIGAEQWNWLQLSKNEQHTELNLDNMVKGWLSQIEKSNTNILKASCQENGEKVVNGSLIYKQNLNIERDHKIFHFFLTEKQLVTIDLELAHQELQMDKTENAVEGFLLILSELINEMLVEIDKFEEALKTLIWSVRKRNETGILEQVYLRRHELLIWKNLLIPINEVKMAIDEIGFPGISDGDIFTCTCKRIERALVLLGEYEHELDSLINLEEVISSHRGNEIMKTLTVMTTIFTPIMAFGSLWGMNFKHMPELEWRFGYPFAIFSIVCSTFLLFGYLKLKGWTGDLLKGKKKGSFFK